VRWDAANARARGLGARLLTRPVLVELAGVGSWERLLRRLEEVDATLVWGGGEGGGGSGESEGLALLLRRVARRAGARLMLLGRWLGPKGRAVLGVVFEDEARRALRVLLRGAVQGASPLARLSCAVPTPDLPERLLARLARAGSPAEFAGTLLQAGHPAGRALEVELRAGQAALLDLELALGRSFAARVSRVSRRGGALVRRFTRLLLDLENARALLLAPQWGARLRPRDVWLAGGEALSVERFEQLAALGPAAIRPALARCFSSSPVAAVFAEEEDFEGGCLAALIEWLRQPALRDPLGPAPVLVVLQRIRAEARDLACILTGVALGAPAPRITSHLVTSA
jgi:vacuolar-type H+-ATPase subunit C/Vma6